jgi:hypothetical protein
MYKVESRKYEQKRTALAAISRLICASVPRRHLSYIKTRGTVHSKIKAVKAHLAPTDMGRRLDLRSEYRDLLKTPRVQVMERTWIERYERVFAEMVTLALPEKRLSIEAQEPHRSQINIESHF